MEIINAQPRMAGNPYVFAGAGKGPISAFSTRHGVFKRRCGVDNFHLHDLRRTARSLMARAGVPSEHAERVLGHAIVGVEGVYDRHHYQDEMADALKRLARLIENHRPRRAQRERRVDARGAAVSAKKGKKRPYKPPPRLDKAEIAKIDALLKEHRDQLPRVLPADVAFYTERRASGHTSQEACSGLLMSGIADRPGPALARRSAHARSGRAGSVGESVGH